MKLKLINKKEIAPGVREISFDIKNKNFTFNAGQYVRLVLPRLDIDDTKGPARLFSIASSPNDKEKLNITFRMTESGYKKTLANMQFGEEAEFEGPWGSFTLPETTEKPIVFVAGGTGITPFLSMMSFATEEKLPHRINLIYASRDKNNILYASELKELAKRNSRLKIELVTGLIDEKIIRKNSPKDLKASFYISGTPATIDYVRGMLGDIGASGESIYYEEWSNLDFLNCPVKNMFDVSTDAIFLTDLAGIIKYANPAWENMTGFKADDVVDKCTPRIQKSGKQGPEYYKEIWDYHLNGKVFQKDVINKRKDETLYEVDHLYLPLFSEAKEIIGFAAFQREISEEKIREHYQSKVIIENFGEMLVVVDKDGKILMANKVFEDALKVKDIIGKYYFNIWQMKEGDKILPLNERPIQIALAKGEKISTNKYSYIASDGRSIPVSIIASPIIINDRISGAVVSIRDITREKEIDRAKTEFISIASHQLKTPLIAISWIIERLTSGKVGKFTKKQKDYMDNVYNSSQRMTKLVNDLLSVSQLEDGKIRIEAKPLQLKDIIKKIITAYKFLSGKKKCQITFSKPEEELPLVSLDESLMRQILGNLLTNAVRYSKNSCRIEVKLEKKGNNFLLTISDEGIGIPKDKQHRVFEKFFRADNAQKLHTDGTGLGLYITKMMVELLGGKIWFESKEGKGTIFYVELPLIHR